MKGFIFETKKGNFYFYSDTTGEVIFIKSKDDIKNFSNKYQKSYFYDDKIVNITNIKNYIKKEEVKNYFLLLPKIVILDVNIVLIRENILI
ncbi:hypothetical protein [Marinitoga sp. 1155]|uniref:hypothetical protein n=1 Tax=Marinitoga sp. 1155 TaxID=1428448 RepID=UPI000640F440|nr:hypothetical protein [Marinitoga sp. 1155]KLO22276.1 hypothetical protein X274_09115 [Marinitoga sp. 1155]